MSPSRSWSAARGAATAALTIATTGAALLAIDNLLGFIGPHLITAGSVAMVAAIAVSAGVVATAGAALARDAARAVVAVAVLGFVAALSPATSSHLWFPIAIVLQTLVPLAFTVAGLLLRRCSRNSAVVRVLEVMLLGFAAAWTVASFIPVALVAFLSAQAGTLVVAGTLSLQPVLRRGRSLARELWTSADIR